MQGEENRFSGVRALIFDLDGTLIDSKLDLALSINAMLKRMGRAELAHEEIFRMVGNGAPVLVRRALGAEPWNPRAIRKPTRVSRIFSATTATTRSTTR